MQPFEGLLAELVATVRSAPWSEEARRAVGALIDSAPQAFEALVPPEVLQFGVARDKLDRRLNYLKQLLMHGYDVPRVELNVPFALAEDGIGMAVCTSYFYPNGLSLLEAALDRNDIAVMVVYPFGEGSNQWLRIRQPSGATARIDVSKALMLDRNGLVWREFKQPVPAHFLFPVDNYYRAKYRLVDAYQALHVPMPGSNVIRTVCEDKRVLAAIAGAIPGLKLASEICVQRGTALPELEQDVDRFVAEHRLTELVSKPIDGFGGRGVAFWELPRDRDAMLDALIRDIRDGDILIQGRIRPVPTVSGLGWNMRQYVVRQDGGGSVSRWKRARQGSGAINTTQGASSVAVGELLQDIRLSLDDRKAFERVLARTDGLAVAVLEALEAYLEREWREQRISYAGSGSNLEPDLLALDFMIAEDANEQDGFAVYLNEINDFASGGMRNYEYVMHRWLRPTAARVLAQQPFSLAPRILDLAVWRGRAYKAATKR
ncbi:MAG: hypothetical protein NVSMB42_20190 [Herpetosiphon sp.]